MPPKKGYHLSEETRNKISAALKGHKHSLETRNKISAAHKPHKLSEETKAKISDSLKGHKHTEGTKRKMSESLNAFLNSEAGETRKKRQSEVMTGKRWKLSEEKKKKLSEIHKGYHPSDSTIEAIVKSKNRVGRKVIIDGVEYKSMKKAAEALGIDYSRMVGYCRYKRDEFYELTGHHIDWVEKK